MTFLRLRKMPKTPMREEDRGHDEVMGKPDGTLIRRRSPGSAPSTELDGRVGGRAHLQADVWRLRRAGGAASARWPRSSRPAGSAPRPGTGRYNPCRAAAERLGVADAGRRQRRDARRAGRADGPAAADQDELRAAARARSERRSADTAGSPRAAGEIDVQHHHDEQEQHRHRADIDDDQHHRQELGADQDEQAGRGEEGEDQEQHRMDGVARGMTMTADATSDEAKM